MKTNYQLPTTALMQAVNGIAEKGGPSWPEWCDLGGYIDGEMYVDCEVVTESVECPPAVAAAVCWYAGEVSAWMNRKGEGHNITLWPDDESETWGVTIWICGREVTSFSQDSQHEASAALIIAVDKALEGE